MAHIKMSPCGLQVLNQKMSNSLLENKKIV